MTGYVQLAEAAALGAAGDVTQAHLDAATMQANAWMKRPEGLIYEVDSTGNPVCMAGLAQRASFTAPPLTPGLNVQASLGGPVAMLQVGDVLVADRGAASAEALTVAAIQGQTVTFRRVRNAHDGTQTLQYGLVLTEERSTARDRALVRLSRTKIASVLSGVGRYGYQRRGDIPTVDPNTLFALAVTFGGPPVWELFDPSQAAINAESGQVWVPMGMLMANYSDVRLHYVAGFPGSVPNDVKTAVVKIANQLAFSSDGVTLKSENFGGMQYERFGGRLEGGGVVDQATAELLQPYKVMVMA
ncbi:hypothetical protein JFK97_06795 [Chromobacterium phragmitis]|uniref:hypothetical protein n=1 Tax=Chromobacterium amazonense TaxID=1382803 RepID=UPI0021B7A0AB|nr:hypothetical protein [Chromobacterium amazonense]MBM2884095.1 hypothetical protein [Chromobacterium amazonense]